MLNEQLILSLETLQNSLCVKEEYKVNSITPGCGNGPTNCQNQW